MQMTPTYWSQPKKNTYLIPQEIDNITDWVRANNLKLNSAKCCEIIMSLPTSDRINLPPPHTGLTRVEDITALGVTFSKTLSFEPHVLKSGK